MFDKALTEPTFCELYSELCRDMSKELPDFEDPEGNVGTDGKQMRITFRRILLNKCQMEFEKGANAKAAVENREKAARATPGVSVVFVCFCLFVVLSLQIAVRRPHALLLG